MYVPLISSRDTTFNTPFIPEPHHSVTNGHFQPLQPFATVSATPHQMACVPFEGFKGWFIMRGNGWKRGAAWPVWRGSIFRSGGKVRVVLKSYNADRNHVGIE